VCSVSLPRLCLSSRSLVERDDVHADAGAFEGQGGRAWQGEGARGRKVESVGNPVGRTDIVRLRGPSCMKGHTLVLLDIAKSDIELAKKALPDDPANAAFHAQQCSEKAVKAVAFELGDYNNASDFDMIGKMLGHNSTRTCLALIGIIAKRLWKESRLDQNLTHLRSMWTERKDKETALAYLLAKQAHSLSVEMQKTLVSYPKRLSKAYWFDSLDPGMIPKPLRHKRLSGRITEEMEDIQEMLDVGALLLGPGTSDIHRLFDSPVDLSPQGREAIERAAAALRKLGKTEVAAQLEAMVSATEYLFRPEFISWYTLVVSWARYLDAHAEKGRYQDGVQRKMYREHVSGVQNLVGKAEQILEQTGRIIILLSGCT